ncbi:MAG: hypothetical protein ACYC4M_09640 [Thermoleophilia bacterium]
MADQTRKLAKRAREVLESGEDLVAGVRVTLKGTAVGMGLAVGLGGIGGIAIGSKLMDKGREAASDHSGIELTQLMALGLTDRRLIIWKRSQATGKTREIIGEIPLVEVVDVSFEPRKLGDRLTLTLTGDRSLELEVARIDKGQRFADRLKPMLA